MQEVFTFNIHEAIAFDREQQIKEMLGIGLEPVISMEEIGNTLSIRGVMELKGEYIKNNEPSDDTEQRQTEATYVERVESLSDEVNEFFHKFLIDVSIPMERIASLDEVSIEVEHFDYSLDMSDEMVIEATLAVHGIRDNEIEVEELDNTLPSLEENRLDEEKEDSNEFHFNVEEPEEIEEEQEKVVPIQSKREEVIEEVAQPEELVREAEEELESELEEENEELEKSEEKLNVKAREERLNETSYLLNIFAEEETSSYTRLKLYIVQPDDQIQSIAERYQVSPRNIMRTNNLEEEDVSAGQLIYIPVSVED
ncbi:LysM peptidoglycan-binding domain-containing protein [Gracilibacillus massiliensis]|uniref:LysM peptidoglycan-binding domain-containing protein n=1 Tax=Gracilibacillus massiliensis TaxID=1564956 RepID=UPI00071E12B8|nr:LysM peptidoglycan-binding domain-containing protein [Gracilibacillus massiliensis]